MKTKNINAGIFSLIILYSSLSSASYIGVSADAWAYSWQLNDRPDSVITNSPINHEFKIENSVASSITINSIFGLDAKELETIQDLPFIREIPFSLNLYQTGTSKSSDESSEVSSVMGISATLGVNLAGYIQPAFKMTTYENKGTAIGYDPSNLARKSHVSFKTEFSTTELTFKFPFLGDIFKDLFIGYRKTDYTAPQSVYVMLDKNMLATTTGSKQVDPAFNWQANYYLIGYEKWFGESDSKFNWKLSSYYGQGTANVKSEVLSEVKNYVKEGSANILSADVAISYDLDMLGSLKTTLGYRYYQETLKLGQNDSIHVYAESKSTHSGPYLGLRFVW